MKWYLKALKQYADFNGRARRKEYWMYTLFNIIFAMVALLLDNILGIAFSEIGMGPLYGIYILATFIPGLAVMVRRLHDIGKSGSMIFISLIPFIGSIWILVLMLTKGEQDKNQYGPDPKAEEADNPEENQISEETLIIIVISFMVINKIFRNLYYSFLEIGFYPDSIFFEFLNKILSLFWAFVPLILAFTIKDKRKQTVLFVFAGIYMMHSLYNSIIEPYILDKF